MMKLYLRQSHFFPGALEFIQHVLAKHEIRVAKEPNNKTTRSQKCNLEMNRKIF